MTKGARGLAQSRPAGRALALVLTATSKCCPRCFHLWEMLVLHIGSPVTSAARTDVASRVAPIPPWPTPTPAIPPGCQASRDLPCVVPICSILFSKLQWSFCHLGWGSPFFCWLSRAPWHRALSRLASPHSFQQARSSTLSQLMLSTIDAGHPLLFESSLSP